MGHAPRPVRRRRTRRCARRTALALASGTTPAQAEPGDVVQSFDVDVDVRTDGSLQVREQIEYTFGGSDRHGIYRYVQTRYDIKDEPKFERLIDLEDISVSSPSGAPAKKSVSDDGQYKVIRIGDEDENVSGTQTYVISYVVRGAMNGAVNGFDLAELSWDATGHGWDAPIIRTSVSVSGPAPVEQVACFAGPAGSSLPCESTDVSGPRAEFTEPQARRGRRRDRRRRFPDDGRRRPGPGVGATMVAGPRVLGRAAARAARGRRVGGRSRCRRLGRVGARS